MTETVDALLRASVAAKRNALSEADAKSMLRDYGVHVPRGVTVGASLHGIDRALDALHAPYALKVMSPNILHKSDAGGVQLNLADSEAVAQAITTMSANPLISAAEIDGFLVEEMASPGIELVIGAIRDPDFGPMVMLGLGGIFVEVLADVAFRICPIERSDVEQMLQELKGSVLLDGVRGRTPVSREAIIDVVLRIAGNDGLLMHYGDQIEEIDLNPVIVNESELTVVDARVILSSDGCRDSDTELVPQEFSDQPVLERFTRLFEPRSIAVVGASATRAPLANTFIRRMQDYGYPGTIYPVHPKAQTIEGLPAYPSLAALPEPVDYAYVAMGASRIAPMLECANNRVRFVHVISSGFGEVEHGRELEAQLIKAARQGGCRVLGPNCLGLYSPRGGVTFSVGAPKELGHVGILSQSGGLSTDIIKRGQWRGLTFSALVSVGNCADIKPAELLEYLQADPHTRVIGLYLEDIKGGRRFFELLRADQARKPVVVLRGGRSRQGRLAAASHTGALAGDARAWQALSRQTGCVMVDSVDEFIDVLLALQTLPLRRTQPTQRVVLFGNGGGTSVLATDHFADQGLDVLPFEAPARDRLEALGLPPGTSVANPIDTPVGTLQEQDGFVAKTILDIVYDHALPDAIVMHLNLAAFVGRGTVDPVDNLIHVIETVQGERLGQCHLVLVLRSDGSAELEERKRVYRERALKAGIVVYDELVNAARALKGVAFVESFCHALS